MATKRLLGISWVSVCVYGLFSNQGGENIDPIFFHTALHLKFFLWVLRGVLLFSFNLPTSYRGCQEKNGFKEVAGSFLSLLTATPLKRQLQPSWSLLSPVFALHSEGCFQNTNAPFPYSWRLSKYPSCCFLGLELAQAWYCAGHNNCQIYICGKLQGCSWKRVRPGVKKSRIQTLDLPCIRILTLRKAPNFSELQFAHL